MTNCCPTAKWMWRSKVKKTIKYGGLEPFHVLIENLSNNEASWLLSYHRRQNYSTVEPLLTTTPDSQPLWKCSHVVLNSLITHTTPTGNIPEPPELGTPLYNRQNFGSRRCPLLRGSTVLQWSDWSTVLQWSDWSILGCKIIYTTWF